MYPLEVIPSRQWHNAETGRTASLYGAAPQGDGWQIRNVGYTLRMANGTVGCGRPPFPTREDAVAFANAWLARIGRESIQ